MFLSSVFLFTYQSAYDFNSSKFEEKLLSDCSTIASSVVICNDGNSLAILLSIVLKNGESLYSGKLINFKNKRKI